MKIDAFTVTGIDDHMDSQNLGKTVKRHVLCEMNNTEGPKASRCRGKVKFTGFPNIEKLIYVDEKKSTQNEKNSENQTQNCPEPSSISKETIILVKDIQRDGKLEMEENHYTISQLHVPGNAVMKENKSKNSIEESKVRMDKNYNNDTENISPSLTNLICKSKIDKITRPPNAFMLFAKEHRQKIRKENPDESNRGISIMLGNMWKAMSTESKTKYYHDANALEKLHKQKYPEYVYSPSEARRQKQTRILKKLRQKESPKKRSLAELAKNDYSNNKSDGRYSSRKSDQEASLEFPTGNSKSGTNEFSNSGGHASMERYLNSSTNPLHSPVYWPFLSKWRPPIDSPPPFIGLPPFCHCQGSSPTTRSPLGPQQPPSFRMNYPHPPTKFNPSYPTFPSPMIHPAVWNPWVMFPNPYYPMNSSPHTEEFYKNWMARHPFPPPTHLENNLQQRQQNIPKTQESKSQVNDPEKTNEPQTGVNNEPHTEVKNETQTVTNDDDSSHSLVIVEDSGDDIEKENLMNVKERANKNIGCN